MYEGRLRRNFRAVIERHGAKVSYTEKTLESISPRHCWSIVNGKSTITLKTLEAVADEVGADMLEFFE